MSNRKTTIEEARKMTKDQLIEEMAFMESDISRLGGLNNDLARKIEELSRQIEALELRLYNKTCECSRCQDNLSLANNHVSMLINSIYKISGRT